MNPPLSEAKTMAPSAGVRLNSSRWPTGAEGSIHLYKAPEEEEALGWCLLPVSSWLLVSTEALLLLWQRMSYFENNQRSYLCLQLSLDRAEAVFPQFNAAG